MGYEQRDFSGTISKNTRKTDERHPDISGKAMVDGVMYYVNGWKKTSSKDNSTFYSLSFKPIDEAQQAPRDKGDDDGVF